MKKITLFLLMLSVLSMLRVAAQPYAPVVSAGSAISTILPGQSISVPVTVTVNANTSSVSAFNLKLTYDPAIVTVTGFTSSFLTTNDVNFATSGLIAAGYYGGGPAIPMSNGTVLLNIIFTKVATGSTSISFDIPNCYFFDLDDLELLSDPGFTNYNSGNLTLQGDAPHTTANVAALACPGQTISVPVVVSDYNTIGAVSLALKYNSAVLSYVSGTNNTAIPITITGTTPGTVFITNIAGLYSLPNGTTFFTLTFTYNGGYTDLSWFDTDGTSCEYAGPPVPPNFNVLPDTPTGTYYLNGSVGPSPSTWTGTTSTAWTTLGNWSCDVPTAYTDVTIGTSANYPVIPAAADITVKSLTINAGSVTVSPTAKLTVTNTLANTMGNDGLVIKSDASGTGSLIHNTADVAGTVERYISGSAILTANLYHQVSVPLASSSNPTSNLFLDSYLYDFTESSSVWHSLGESTTTPLDVDKGYLIYYPNTSHTYTFAGTLRAGTVSPSISFTDGDHGLNLVPNPYPSAIDWTLTTKANLADAIWIWNSAFQNYGAYGTETGTGTSATTKYIAVGQSFFVRADATAPAFTMENADRVHNAQAFLKNTQTIENQLHLTADGNHSRDEIVLAFNDKWSAATESADVSKMYGSEGSPQLNTVASDGSKLSIDARQLTDGDVIVPLNFSLTETTAVTFTASGLETFNAGTPILLEDLMLNTTTDLRSNPVYTFSHSAGDTENRFRLVFNVTTAINKQTGITQGRIFVDGGMLHIDIAGMQQAKATIALYDATGRRLSSQTEVILGQVQIAAPSAAGMYIVRVTGSNKTFTAKVVVD